MIIANQYYKLEIIVNDKGIVKKVRNCENVQFHSIIGILFDEISDLRELYKKNTIITAEGKGG